MSTQHIPLTNIQPLQSLRSSVTEALRTAVIVGDLVEGELYSAPALAEPLGVSATPVREAMMDLTNEGMVTPVKNKGFRITSMSKDDLKEITAVRQLLEVPAVQSVVGHIPESAFEGLYRQAEKILKAAEQSDLRTYLGEDRAFHAEILKYAGNNRLVHMCTQLRGQTRLKALHRLAEQGQLPHSAREHIELLDRIREGDMEGVYHVTMRHIGHAAALWAEGEEDDSQAGMAPVSLLRRNTGSTGNT